MSDVNSKEIWNVEVNGQVYEASFAKLTDWIAEGALQPEDKVRRGNLRWIEAKKVPTLVAFFNAKTKGLPLPAIVVSTTDCCSTESESAISEKELGITYVKNNVSSGTVSGGFSSTTAPDTTNSNDGVEGLSVNCVNHIERPAKFVCLTCCRLACRECVKAFGSSVMICSACGGMCKAKDELEAANRQLEFRQESIDQGFGFSDFGRAIAYPFRFKTSLIFGALMFMFFSLGRSASSFGGIYMVVASIFSFMLANMLAFGILSNTIDNFAHGNLTANFMPEFEDFSVWDDVIHPFFLSIGVYISAFGPFIVVFVLGAYLVMSSVSSELNSMKANLEQTPGTPYYNVRDTVDQSNDVNDVLNRTKQVNQERIDAQEHIANGHEPAAVEQDPQNFEQINKMIAEGKRKELEAVVGKTAETRGKESAAFFNSLLKLAAPIVVIGFIALLWGLFFFPAACTVAGYTKSFVATVNPFVGLDTIKRLGFDYVKVLFMSLLMLIAFALASMLFAIVFTAFDMPGVGNVPAKAFESIIWFYLVIVFACLLGFVLFKASDRLRLQN